MYKARLKTITFEISRPISIDKDVVFQGTGTVEAHIVKSTHKNNEEVTTVSIVPIALEVQEADTKLEAPVFKDYVREKSPSKRLRDALFVLHQQKQLSIDFEQYYERYMIDLIDAVRKEITDDLYGFEGNW